jgi:hypothetical protein
MNFTSTDGAGGTAGQPDDPLATAEVVDAGHPYTTRILVRRPTDADSFNGTVIVEWFNVSLSQDVDFVFAATHDYLLSNGYAWVGVSAQLPGTNALKQANPARYSNLNLDASNDDPGATSWTPKEMCCREKSSLKSVPRCETGVTSTLLVD